MGEYTNTYIGVYILIEDKIYTYLTEVYGCTTCITKKYKTSDFCDVCGKKLVNYITEYKLNFKLYNFDVNNELYIANLQYCSLMQDIVILPDINSSNYNPQKGFQQKLKMEDIKSFRKKYTTFLQELKNKNIKYKLIYGVIEHG